MLKTWIGFGGTPIVPRGIGESLVKHFAARMIRSRLPWFELGREVHNRGVGFHFDPLLTIDRRMGGCWIFKDVGALIPAWFKTAPLAVAEHVQRVLIPAPYMILIVTQDFQ